jgi:Xaa-Pro aminopeptidase
MDVRERITSLRELMTIWGWEFAVISGTDPHNSEYTPKRWSQREFISGFTGSAGTVVVTAGHAGLWTDSRYYIQAVRELEGSGIELHKTSLPDSLDWADWIGHNISDLGKVGIDGLCMSSREVEYLFACVASRYGEVISHPDYLNRLWKNRPPFPDGKVWLHDIRFSGCSTSEKLSWVREEIGLKGADCALVSSLDQVAWLLNIRSNDVDYCPFVISFAIIEPSKVALFIDKSKVDADVESVLASDRIELYSYDEVTDYIRTMKDVCRIFIDPSSLNFELNNAVINRFGKDCIVIGASPIELKKSMKNSVEIDGFRRAFILDGIAQTRFYHWLEDCMKAEKVLTEADLSDKIHSLRAENPDFMEESFETISAYGENAALPHYSTVRGKDATLKPNGLYLMDSGAHYRFGTTDITRTIPLGPVSQLEKEDYTLVLKAMIDLAMAVFPEGTPGCRLDAVARKPLWQTMRNFGHGTGHGVGNLLSVHEGPQSIRQNMKDQPIFPGMITSDEPGIYREGKHGIRHENIILCIPAGENEFGRWLKFETLTMTYLDTTPLIIEMLDKEERFWLNEYNALVEKTLCPLLCEQDAAWLRSKTKTV